MPDTTNVKIYRVDPSVPLPTKMVEGSSGHDLAAFISDPLTLKPFEPTLISTGICISLPQGFEAQVRPRSSMSKKGLVSPVGTVDAGYTGVIFACIINCTHTPYTIHPGDRIAQLVVAHVPEVAWEEVGTSTDLGETKRGSGGFGSTGV